jgi:hypothetical protein
MATILKDNTRIYFLLEKANMLFDDFTIDHVVAFDLEDDFYVIVYTSANKNFVCFSGEGYLQNRNILASLIQYVQEYNDTDGGHLYEKAVKLIEEKMYSKNNSGFFFDAH